MRERTQRWLARQLGRKKVQLGEIKMAMTAPNGVARTLSSDAQLMQEYLQSTGIIVNAQSDGVGQVAAFQNAEGETEAVVVDPDDNLFHACREPLSDSGCNIYVVGAGLQKIAAVDSVTAFACGNDRNLWASHHRRWTETRALPSGGAAAGASAGKDGTFWVTHVRDGRKLLAIAKAPLFQAVLVAAQAGPGSAGVRVRRSPGAL